MASLAAEQIIVSNFIFYNIVDFGSTSWIFLSESMALLILSWYLCL